MHKLKFIDNIMSKDPGEFGVNLELSILPLTLHIVNNQNHEKYIIIFYTLLHLAIIIKFHILNINIIAFKIIAKNKIHLR